MKKFLATLLVGTVAVTSVLGFTACGGDKNSDIPKGEKVTEEEWKAAITATLDTDNFTMIENFSYSITQKGNDGKDVTRTESIRIEIYSAEREGYSKHTENSKTISEEGIWGAKTTSEYYDLIENLNYWMASLRYTEYIQGYDSEDYKKDMPKWEARKFEYPDEIALEEDLQNRSISKGQLAYPYYTGEDSDEAIRLIDLYSAFTYSDGKYTADLYKDGQKAKVEVSIKDGYVAGCHYSYKAEGDGGIYIRGEACYTVVYKDYGSTTVTVPKGATDAMDKVKAEENK